MGERGGEGLLKEGWGMRKSLKIIRTTKERKRNYIKTFEKRTPYFVKKPPFFVKIFFLF